LIVYFVDIKAWLKWSTNSIANSNESNKICLNQYICQSSIPPSYSKN